MTDPSTTSNPTPPQPVVSPPTISTTSTSATSPDSSDPISPVGRTGTFPHKSAAGLVSPSRPFIEVSTPAINDNPVELDSVGTSTSPEELKRRETEGKEGSAGKNVSPGLGEDDDIAAEFLGEGERGVGRAVREKRAEMLASRSKDPGVIVDVPQDPTAEEVEAAKSGEGTVTPGLPAGDFEPAPEKN